MARPYHRAARTACLLAVGSLMLSAVSLSIPAGAQPTCPLDPVTIPLFDGTPAAVVVASPGLGEDAPEVDEATVRDAIETIVTCANNASPAVRYSVFTDRYLAGLFTGLEPADQPAFERMIATGGTPEPVTSTLEEITDVEHLPDGRIAVTLRIATPDGTVVDRLALAWDSDQGAWLIDEILALDPPPATPEG